MVTADEKGIKIKQSEASSFKICFDSKVVGGTQTYGNVIFVDSNQQSDSCKVYDTFPDFCAGTDTSSTLSNKKGINLFLKA